MDAIDQSGTLLTIAQIAITLVGFTGIVLVLGERSSLKWGEAEYLRIFSMVSPTLMVLLACFIPILLVDFVDSEEAIAACSPTVRALLSPAHEQRSRSEKMAATWVHFEVPGALDRAGGFPLPEHRHHRLQLRREVAGDDVALVCDIKLFGGAFEATVQLTPRLSPSQLESAEYVPEVIDF